MIVQMHTNVESYTNILMGTKTVELRLNDKKRKAIKIGDIIVFTNNKNNKEKVRTKVESIYKFTTFEELYLNLPHSKLGYRKDLTGDPRDMKKYYDDRKLSEHEVLGLEFRVIDRLTENAIYDIESKINYVFKNKALLMQAFTKTSFAKDKDIGDSEVLEFLGDSVLGYYVTKMLAEYLVQKEGETLNNEYNEGDLTELRSLLVENRNLEAVIKQYDFTKYLLVAEHHSIRSADKSDLLESIIGAVALDANYDEEVLYNLVEKFTTPRIYLSSFYSRDYLEMKRYFKIRNIKNPSIKTSIVEQNGKDNYVTTIKFSKYLVKASATTKIDSLFRAAQRTLVEIRNNGEDITAKDFLHGLTAHNGRIYLDKLQKRGFYKELSINEKRSANKTTKITYDIGSFSTWYRDRDKRKAHKICALATINALLSKFFSDDETIKNLILKLDPKYFD